MKIAVAGATGFVGSALVEKWLKEKHTIVVIGRSAEAIRNIFGTKVIILPWKNFDSLAQMCLKDADAVVNLSGAGIADKRWSEARKKEILDSRMESAKVLANWCAAHKTPLLNASAIGIYGIQKPANVGLPVPLDEDSPIASESSKDFLSFVCRSWERVTLPLKDLGVRVVNLRIGVVLGKEAGALPKMALPFYFFAGGPIGTGKQPISWIALKDIVNAIDFILHHPQIKGPVNLVSPKCVTQEQLADALGKVLKRPSAMPTPALALKIVLGSQLAQELLLSGQHIRPSKLLEYGFNFQYSNIKDALGDIYLNNH